MKKGLIALTAASVLILASCGAAEVDTDVLASKLAAEGSFAEQLTEVSDAAAGKYLRLDADEFTDIAAYSSTAAVADEVVVIKTGDADEVTDEVREYLEERIKSYQSYRPDEVPKLRDAVIKTVGDCVVLCVSEDPSLAQTIIDEYK